MKDMIKIKFNEFGIELTDRQAEQFDEYMKFLLEENEKFNLTAITEPNDIILKHFIDSALPYAEIKAKARIIDVGSGAGFPGIPLKILRDDISLVLVDSLQKRVGFLQQLVKNLGLTKVTCVHSRAEDYAKLKRESFDYAVARAVAQINTLSEYLLPFVKIGGMVIMYKGQKAEEELKEGKKAITTLGGKISEVLKYSIEDAGERAVILIKKIKNTPVKYPRGRNYPKNKPIV